MSKAILLTSKQPASLDQDELKALQEINTSREGTVRIDQVISNGDKTKIEVLNVKQSEIVDEVEIRSFLENPEIVKNAQNRSLLFQIIERKTPQLYYSYLYQSGQTAMKASPTKSEELRVEKDLNYTLNQKLLPSIVASFERNPSQQLSHFDFSTNDNRYIKSKHPDLYQSAREVVKAGENYFLILNDKKRTSTEIRQSLEGLRKAISNFQDQLLAKGYYVVFSLQGQKLRLMQFPKDAYSYSYATGVVQVQSYQFKDGPKAKIVIFNDSDAETQAAINIGYRGARRVGYLLGENFDRLNYPFVFRHAHYSFIADAAEGIFRQQENERSWLLATLDKIFLGEVQRNKESDYDTKSLIRAKLENIHETTTIYHELEHRWRLQNNENGAQLKVSEESAQIAGVLFSSNTILSLFSTFLFQTNVTERGSSYLHFTSGVHGRDLGNFFRLLASKYGISFTPETTPIQIAQKVFDKILEPLADPAAKDAHPLIKRRILAKINIELRQKVIEIYQERYNISPLDLFQQLEPLETVKYL